MDGKIFSGWQESAKTTTYYYGSTFFLNEPNNVRLFPIYVDDSEDLVYYYPNGGLGGVQAVSDSSTWVDLSPTGTPVSNSQGTWISDTIIPCRLGYRFAGWKSNKTGDIKQPGDKVNTNNQGRSWSAVWEGVNGTCSNTQSSYFQSVSNGEYDHYRHTFSIAPATYKRTCYIQYANYTGIFTWFDYALAIRVFDENGNTVPNSYCRWVQDDASEAPRTSNFTLLANRTYQIEFASETWKNEGSWDKNRKYEWTFYQTPVPITETISANGGSFKVGNNSYYSSDNVLITDLSPNTNWIGISSNTDSGLSVFNNITKKYPGLPDNHTGYWYSKKWIGTTEMIPNYLQTISSITAWATPLPQKDFSVSAVWNPNKFYIRYNGNGNDAGTVMANSSHDYNKQITLAQNCYTRSTKIIYKSRKGYYSNDSDWVENDTDYMDVIIGSGADNRAVKLNHTYLGWACNGTNLSDQQSIAFANWKTITGQSLETYGDQVEITARWQFNSVKLPEMYREGFKFLGWFTEAEGGTFKGNGGDSYTYDGKEITLYAHWEPIGLVQIYVDNEWKYAIPYVCRYNETTKKYEWKRSMSYTHNDTSWKQGTGSGQNMTDEQLENL